MLCKNDVHNQKWWHRVFGNDISIFVPPLHSDHLGGNDINECRVNLIKKTTTICVTKRAIYHGWELECQRSKVHCQIQNHWWDSGTRTLGDRFTIALITKQRHHRTKTKDKNRLIGDQQPHDQRRIYNAWQLQHNISSSKIPVLKDPTLSFKMISHEFRRLGDDSTENSQQHSVYSVVNSVYES